MWSGYTGYDNEGNKLNPSIPTPEEKLEAKIKELEQQLLEQAAYGVYLRTKIQGSKTIDANPSQVLINQMKAKAVREYGEHLSHAEDRLTPEDYAKKLEQTKA